jgi:hypothetical protein
LSNQAFAFILVLVSHPILPHSSTPLLFFLPADLIVNLLTLRTTTYSTSTSTPILAIQVIKLVLLATFLSVEVLGPDGFPSRIKLGDSSDIPEPHVDGEWTQKPCPRIRANIYSRLTFGWLTPLMKEGNEKFLTEEDLWSLPVS